MTTSVIVRLVLIIALVVFLIVWRSGLREKWKNRGKDAERQRLEAEREEQRKRQLQQRRREEEQAAKIEETLSRAAEGARLRSLRFAGSEISYFEAGERDAPRRLLLLHGLADRKEDWGPLIERLASLGCRVVAPDLPGFGQSTSDEDDPDILAHLRRLRTLTTKLELEPCILVGSGLGGTLAAAWAYREPDTVAGLVLLEPFGLRLPYPTDLEERIEAGSNPLLPGSPNEFAALDELLFVAPPERDPGIEELRRQGLLRHRAHLEKVWDRSRADDRVGLLDLVLPEIDLPTLYVQGGESRVVHPKTAELVPKLAGPNVRVEVIPGCGHLPAVERPQETGSVLLGFLRDLQTERSAVET